MWCNPHEVSKAVGWIVRKDQRDEFPHTTVEHSGNDSASNSIKLFTLATCSRRRCCNIVSKKRSTTPFVTETWLDFVAHYYESAKNIVQLIAVTFILKVNTWGEMHKIHTIIIWSGFIMSVYESKIIPVKPLPIEDHREIRLVWVKQIWCISPISYELRNFSLPWSGQGQR